MQERQTRQPTPQNRGENVPVAFQAWAEHNGFSESVALSVQRDRFGQDKYGQPLMTEDGRVTMADATDEMGDLLHYVFKARMNGESVEEVKQHIPALITLLLECEHGSLH